MTPFLRQFPIFRSADFLQNLDHIIQPVILFNIPEKQIVRCSMTQEGLIALTRAIQKYQPEKGIQFWTYAETVVRNAITDYIRKIMSEYEVWVNILSLNASISDDDSEERSFEETIPNEHSKTPEQIYIEKENLSEIHDALNHISARERDYHLSMSVIGFFFYR